MLSEEARKNKIACSARWNKENKKNINISLKKEEHAEAIEILEQTKTSKKDCFLLGIEELKKRLKNNKKS